MNKIKIIFITLILIFISNFKVCAKDTLISINKYKEENYSFIQDSYDKNGKKDGLILAGKSFDKKKDIKDYQIILEKYNYDGKKIWDFSYGEYDEDYIDNITYTYNEKNEIDGYLITMLKPLSLEDEETFDNEEIPECLGMFIKLDLDGNLVFEKSVLINEYGSIDKIYPIYNDNDEFDGYIAIGTFLVDDRYNSTLVYYDKDLNIVFRKDEIADEGDLFYKDIVNIYDNGKHTGYAVLATSKIKSEFRWKLLKFDKEGNKEVVFDNLNKYYSYNLAEANNGYILYGLTSLVKVDGGEYSYYLINYDINNKEIFESIGEVAINNEEELKLLPLKENKKVKEYFLLYQNNVDLSNEVIKLDQEGFDIDIDYNIEKFLPHCDIYSSLNRIYAIDQNININYYADFKEIYEKARRKIEVKQDNYEEDINRIEELYYLMTNKRKEKSFNYKSVYIGQDFYIGIGKNNIYSTVLPTKDKRQRIEMEACLDEIILKSTINNMVLEQTQPQKIKIK